MTMGMSMLSDHLDAPFYRQPDSGIGTLACQDTTHIMLVFLGSPRLRYSFTPEDLCLCRTLAVDDGSREMLPHTINVVKSRLLHPLEILLQMRAGAS